MMGRIQKRSGKRGTTWRVDYDEPTVVGQLKHRSKTFRTKRKAEKFLAKKLNDDQIGNGIAPTNMTTGDYLERWLNYCSGSIRPSTIYSYRSSIRCYLTPKLGHIPLAKLTPLAIQDSYQRTIDEGFAPSNVGLQHRILHCALQQAVAWRLLSHNPATGIRVPTAPPREVRTWSAQEARQFLSATAQTEHAPLWRLALDTGMRMGELLALRWSDVDLDSSKVAVCRTLTRNERGSWIFGEKTKSANGRRSIAIGPSTVASLRNHRVRQNERRELLGEGWKELGLVFDRRDGDQCSPPVIRRAFLAAVKMAGIPRIRFHDQRHTSATLLLEQGVHPKVVQERLGHANISITIDRYSHVSMNMQQDAANLLERVLGDDEIKK